jgi:hypothetical protein
VFAALYVIQTASALSSKGTTLAPRFGNPTPRIAEAPPACQRVVFRIPGGRGHRGGAAEVKRIFTSHDGERLRFFRFGVRRCVLKVDAEPQVGW